MPAKKKTTKHSAKTEGAVAEQQPQPVPTTPAAAQGLVAQGISNEISQQQGVRARDQRLKNQQLATHKRKEETSKSRILQNYTGRGMTYSRRNGSNIK